MTLMPDQIQRRDIIEKLDNHHIEIVREMATLTAVVAGVKDQVTKQNGTVSRHDQSITELIIQNTANNILIDNLKKDSMKNDRKWSNVVNWMLTVLQSVVIVYVLYILKFR